MERLCRKLGVQPPGSRRALDVALALGRLWDRLLDLLTMEGLQSVGELLRWLGAPARGAIQAALEALPAAPGVYYLLGTAGDVLYVGKARNLRRRVSAHFRQASAYLHGADGLPEQTAAIKYERTGSEFEAVLLEAREIDRLHPRYNVQRAVRQRRPYIRVDQGPFPRAAPAAEVEADGALYFGPYRSTTAVRELVDALHDVFHLASCRRALPPNQRRRPKPPCIRLGLGLCPAPGCCRPRRMPPMSPQHWLSCMKGRMHRKYRPSSARRSERPCRCTVRWTAHWPAAMLCWCTRR
ncbi:MAG: hypothetical protein C4345_11660 [Chloroflexota bacterium]